MHEVKGVERYTVSLIFSIFDDLNPTVGRPYLPYELTGRDWPETGYAWCHMAHSDIEKSINIE